MISTTNIPIYKGIDLNDSDFVYDETKITIYHEGGIEEIPCSREELFGCDAVVCQHADSNICDVIEYAVPVEELEVTNQDIKNYLINE